MQLISPRKISSGGFLLRAASCTMWAETRPLHARLTAKSYFWNYLCNFFYKIIFVLSKMMQI